MLAFTDHGNHTEDSPFLSGADAGGKKNEFYDRNLALFEVCGVFAFCICLSNISQLTGDGTKFVCLLKSSSLLQEEMDIRPKVSSLLSRLVTYTNITQGVKEHEEEESAQASCKKAPKVSVSCASFFFQIPSSLLQFKFNIRTR